MSVSTDTSSFEVPRTSCVDLAGGVDLLENLVDLPSSASRPRPHKCQRPRRLERGETPPRSSSDAQIFDTTARRAASHAAR